MFVWNEFKYISSQLAMEEIWILFKWGNFRYVSWTKKIINNNKNKYNETDMNVSKYMNVHI